MTVAPLAGAWIEIANDNCTLCPLYVAPLAGAWIEIETATYFSPVKCVAPLAGAWIEMLEWQLRVPTVARRSPRGSVD